MATQTLAELANYIDDDRARGIAEDILTVDASYGVMPWIGYSGSSIRVNRETTLGDAGTYQIGDAIIHRAPSAVTQTSFTSTKIIGQVDMDKLVQAHGDSAGADAAAIEISSKAKNIGRIFQQGMASGTGIAPSMNSFHSLVDSSQYTTASAGQALSLPLIDELLDLVTAKNGEVDFLVSHGVIIRAYKALLYAAGGTTPEHIVVDLAPSMPGRITRKVIAHNGIPWFRNDFLSITETANGAALTGGALKSLYAGCWDDGSFRMGCAAIYPKNVQAGITIDQIGVSETHDEDIYRPKLYGNFFNGNRRALARLPSLNNT